MRTRTETSDHDGRSHIPWSTRRDRVRNTSFGDDLTGEVWFNWNSSRGTRWAGTPWFWAVLFQREVIETGNASGEAKAKAAVVEFVRLLRESDR